MPDAFHFAGSGIRSFGSSTALAIDIKADNSSIGRNLNRGIGTDADAGHIRLCCQGAGAANGQQADGKQSTKHLF